MYWLTHYRKGFFNDYMRGLSWAELLMKDAYYLYLRLRVKSPIRILCHPHYPSRGATIFRICRQLGILITNRPMANPDLVFFWEYSTTKKEWHVVENHWCPNKINARSRNISKSIVDHCMQESFGYSAGINPATHIGYAVEKSEHNAQHDGRLVQCPIKPMPDRFYMKLIDSAVSENEVMDLRVPVMRGRIPHVYRSFRSVGARFVNVPPRVELDFDVDKWLTKVEQEKLSHFCEQMQLDFCELDTLRDRESGLLYVVDANDTPQGPPKRLSKLEKERAVLSLSRCFEQVFLEGFKKHC